MEKPQNNQNLDNVIVCYTLEDKNKALNTPNAKWRWATEDERTKQAQSHLSNWNTISNFIEKIKNEIKDEIKIKRNPINTKIKRNQKNG